MLVLEQTVYSRHFHVPGASLLLLIVHTCHTSRETVSIKKIKQFY